MLLAALLTALALAGEPAPAPPGEPAPDTPDEPVPDERADAPPQTRLRWGGAKLTHNQVLVWDVTGEIVRDGQRLPVEAHYYAYEVAGLLRSSLAPHDLVVLGFDVGVSATPGIVYGPGPPWGLGASLTVHASIGDDGSGISTSPVGLVLGAGLRGDGIVLSGISTPTRRDPIVIRPSPDLFAEFIGGWAGWILGVRATWRHQLHWRPNDSTDLRIGRYGGGIVFGGKF